MAKVLLVNPPFYRLLGSHYNANSLGIAYIASYLNKHGHDAWLYNADYVSDKNYGNLKKLFQNFTNYKNYFKGIPRMKEFRIRLQTCNYPEGIHQIIEEIRNHVHQVGWVSNRLAS